jgi:hypothetical protein
MLILLLYQQQLESISIDSTAARFLSRSTGSVTPAV